MAPAYKLTYFNVTALGEPIRLILSYGNIEFEDVRVSFDDWPALKPKMPLGQLPILEHKGKVINQSVAIYRYLGKQTKLHGSNDWEELEIDAAMDTLTEFRMKITAFYKETDPQIKETLKSRVFEEEIPFYVEKLESLAKRNNGYLAVGKLTWVDFAFAGILKYLSYMLLGADITENAPTLRKLRDTVLAIPQVKKYLDNAPEPVF